MTEITEEMSDELLQLARTLHLTLGAALNDYAHGLDKVFPNEPIGQHLIREIARFAGLTLFNVTGKTEQVPADGSQPMKDVIYEIFVGELRLAVDTFEGRETGIEVKKLDLTVAAGGLH